MRETHFRSRIRDGVAVAGGFVLLTTLGALAASAQEREVGATFYGDNYYDFFVNGEHVVSDQRFIPHTAFGRSVTLKTDEENVFAVYLRDNAKTDTGLEYGDRCMGDGGFRFRLDDDSVVSSGDWKCKTVFYGPVNPEHCYGLGLDPTGQRAAFGPGTEAMTAALSRPTNPIPSCRNDRLVPVTDRDVGQDGYFYPEDCQMMTHEWFAAQTELNEDGQVAVRSGGKPVRADWAMPGYDDSTWERAVEYTDTVVGWGRRPNTVDDGGTPWESEGFDETWGPAEGLPYELVEFAAPGDDYPIAADAPADLEWGSSKFIWQPNLRLDNRIVCRLTVPPAGASCTPGDEVLCLGNRFEVTVQWTDAAGNTGTGRVKQLGGDSGSFYFFSRNNVELTVKVLDGRENNGHFWVFYGSMTDVAFELRVTDTVTGEERVYENLLGEMSSGSDTAAFTDPDTGPATAPYWESIEQHGDVPAPLWEAGASFARTENDAGVVYRYGGQMGSFPNDFLVNDFYALDLATATWTSLTTLDTPAGRSDPLMMPGPCVDCVSVVGGRGPFRTGSDLMFPEMWTYDTNSLSWHQASAEELGDPLAVRRSSSLVVSVPASSSQETTFYAFGGVGNTLPAFSTTPTGLRNDLAVYDRDSGWSLVTTSGEKPAPRGWVGGGYEPSTHSILVFGGYRLGEDQGPDTPPFELFGPTNFENDLWSLRLDTLTWTRLEPQGPLPTPRDNVVSFFDTAAGRLVIFGGQGSGTPLSDLWSYSVAENRWTEVTLQPGSPVPPTRVGGVSFVRETATVFELYLHSGSPTDGGSGSFLGDLWKLTWPKG